MEFNQTNANGGNVISAGEVRMQQHTGQVLTQEQIDKMVEDLRTSLTKALESKTHFTIEKRYLAHSPFYPGVSILPEAVPYGEEFKITVYYEQSCKVESKAGITDGTETE